MVDSVEDTACSRAPAAQCADTSTASDGTAATMVDFRRFYNTNYLDRAAGGQSLNRGNMLLVPRKLPHFHRPDYFSYAKDPGIKPRKGGLADVLLSGRSRSKSPASRCHSSRKADEAVKMSIYPGGEPKPNSIKPIERDDFPGPPAPAVLLPEILKENIRKKTLRRLSAGDVIDVASNHSPAEDEDDECPVDPKIQKEIQEIAKLQDSPMAKVILDELTVEINQKKGIDPRSASRVPSAKTEPLAPPRFASSLNASPSRSLDRPRFTDEPLSPPLPKEQATAQIPSPPCLCAPKTVGKPMSERQASTLPPGTPGAFLYEKLLPEEDLEASVHPKSASLSPLSSLEKKLKYPNTTGEFDSVKSEVYGYDEIKLTNQSRRKGLDDFKLEKYLAESEFVRIFGMPRDEFYQMAEFKRNDMKKKLSLF